jgi:uncharacterized membrane protein YdbT with pleckstrin-like domain
MGYVEDHLLPEETIVARTSLHRIVLIFPFMVATVFALPGLGMLASSAGVGFILILVAVTIAGSTWMTYRNAEFAVTSTRLMMKTGWLSQRTLELQLSKVEMLNVEQTLLGRMLGYGTLRVGGTGGTKEVFSMVNRPSDFRTDVQRQLEIVGRHVPSRGESSNTSLASTRVERDCPYCAERILAAATLCRFCNRELPTPKGS